MSTARNLGVTFAGGGNRAFYQVGFLEHWWSRLEPRVAAISACSAGASAIVTWLSGRRDLAHAYWLNRVAAVTSNFRWGELLRGRRPTPHTPIYRDTMRLALEEGGLERIRGLPFPLLILTAIPPPLPLALSVPLGLGVYSLERALFPGRLHPGYARHLGFRPLAVDARGCHAAADLADLILASSATPPFTPVARVRSHRVLDGGVVDNAPAFLCESVAEVERTLVLLTRPYPEPSIGWRGRRLYLAPDAPVPVNRWDYTSLPRIEATIAQGRQEWAARGRVIEEFLAS